MNFKYESFKQKANKKYNNKYTYPEQGYFYQTAFSHYNTGQGCPKCQGNFSKDRVNYQGST